MWGLPLPPGTTSSAGEAAGEVHAAALVLSHNQHLGVWLAGARSAAPDSLGALSSLDALDSSKAFLAGGRCSLGPASFVAP